VRKGRNPIQDLRGYQLKSIPVRRFSVLSIIISRVKYIDKKGYGIDMAKKANQKDFEFLEKQVSILSQRPQQDVQTFLLSKNNNGGCQLLIYHYLTVSVGKIQEIQALVETKANGVEFEVLNNGKIGKEEFQSLTSKIGKLL